MQISQVKLRYRTFVPHVVTAGNELQVVAIKNNFDGFVSIGNRLDKAIFSLYTLCNRTIMDQNLR